MTRSSKLNKRLSKNRDGLSNNKARATLADDLRKTIDAHNQLAKIAQSSLEEVTERLNDCSIVQQALAQIVGVEKVSEASKAIRIQILEAEVTKQGGTLDKAIAEGTLAKAETVTERTLVVTSVKKADGSPLYPSKSYLPFQYYKPEVQAVLLGTKAGDVVTLPLDGAIMEVIGVYVESVPALPEAPPEAPLEAQPVT